MPAVFSYRLRLARPLGGGRGAGRPGPARGRLRTAVLPVGAALAVFLTSGATAALADTPQGGVDVTVPIAMLSLTVAPTSVTLDTCTASEGASTIESLGFFGPSATTDTSSSFTTTVTWIAVL